MYMGIDLQGEGEWGRVNILIQELLWLYIAEAHTSMTLQWLKAYSNESWSSYLKVIRKVRDGLEITEG